MNVMISRLTQCRYLGAVELALAVLLLATQFDMLLLPSAEL